MEGAVGSYKCKGKALASAADDSKDEVLASPTTVPVTKDPDEVIKQPTTTQAEYEKDGNDDPVDLELRLGLGSWNNDDEKKRKAEGEPDKFPMKQKKQVIDINEESPESSQNMTVDLLREFGNEICNSGGGSSETSSDSLDLELRIGLANS